VFGGRNTITKDLNSWPRDSANGTVVLNSSVSFHCACVCMVVKMSRLNKRCVGVNGTGNVKVPDRVGLEIKAEIITTP
jgi:hypothetical protein